MTQQELNLLQLTSRLMAQPCTGPAQVVRCHPWQTATFRVSLHNCPDHLGCKAVSPDSASPVDGPQQWTCIDVGAKGPVVDRFLYPFRNGDRPDVATLSSQVRNDPMAFPKLEILESQDRHFSPPKATADEKLGQGTIAVTAKSLSGFGAQQLLAFFCRQPISETHSQPPDTFHAPYACREVRTEESAIGRFIRQSAYRRQSSVDRRLGKWAVFECDPVPCDHGLVERETTLRAVPVDEFANGMVVRAL